MKKALKMTRIIAFILLLGLLASLFTNVYTANDLSHRLSAEQNKNKNLTSQMQKLSSEYQTMQNNYNDLRAALHRKSHILRLTTGLRPIRRVCWKY